MSINDLVLNILPVIAATISVILSVISVFTTRNLKKKRKDYIELMLANELAIRRAAYNRRKLTKTEKQSKTVEKKLPQNIKMIRRETELANRELNS